MHLNSSQAKQLLLVLFAESNVPELQEIARSHEDDSTYLYCENLKDGVSFMAGLLSPENEKHDRAIQTFFREGNMKCKVHKDGIGLLTYFISHESLIAFVEKSDAQKVLDIYYQIENLGDI